MISDRETNIVFFSDLLEENVEFASTYNRIASILDKYKVKYELLKGTKDIWARDFMPVQIDKNRFVQFRYEPSYLRDSLHLQSDPQEVCKKNNIIPAYSTINLDGGNIVKWDNKVMITDRIFSENPQYTENLKLVLEIEKLLETEVIIIPQIKSDLTGHADGLVKFISETVILGNNIDFEYKYWSTGNKKVLARHNLEYINMPMFEYIDKKYPDAAIGCYMNYLEVGNLIIFPIFEVTNNKDKQAVDLIRSVFPNKHIEPININNIAKHGGLMNCISWNIRI